MLFESPASPTAGSRILFTVMRVRVLFFGVLQDLFEGKEKTVELPDGSSVSDLLGRFAPLTASQERLMRSLAVAVNRDYAKASRVLSDGDEVALLPPVSGGAR